MTLTIKLEKIFKRKLPEIAGKFAPGIHFDHVASAINPKTFYKENLDKSIAELVKIGFVEEAIAAFRSEIRVKTPKGGEANIDFIKYLGPYIGEHLFVWPDKEGGIVLDFYHQNWDIYLKDYGSAHFYFFYKDQKTS